MREITNKGAEISKTQIIINSVQADRFLHLTRFKEKFTDLPSFKHQLPAILQFQDLYILFYLLRRWHAKQHSQSGKEKDQCFLVWEFYLLLHCISSFSYISPPKSYNYLRILAFLMFKYVFPYGCREQLER